MPENKKFYHVLSVVSTFWLLPLFTFHGRQLKESYRAAPQQGGNGEGLVGYYLYFVDHEGEKQIIENTAALSNQIAQQLNSGYKMHQIMQYQQSVAELQLEVIKLGYMGQMLVSGGLAFSYLSGIGGAAGGLAAGSGAFAAGTSYFTPVNACAKAATEKIIEFVAHAALPLAG